MKVAVAGGTGVVGTPLVTACKNRGHEVVVLSRTAGVDLTTGDGLAKHLAGVDVVVDVLSIATASRKKAVQFFTTTTNNLLAAEKEAGVRHHVALSIVGIDGTPYGYYEGKVAQEQAVVAGPVPSTIVRAPQFHEFPGQLLAGVPRIGPLTVVPRMRSATMAAAEVAEVLAEVTEGAPQGRTGDLRGPEIHEMPDLVRRLLEHRGERRWLITVKLPGVAGKRMAEGALVAANPWITGTQTFDAWLAQQ